MIEKQDFYHGAALSRLVDDGRCFSISREPYGYLINEELLVLIRYSTKARTPWGFSFSEEDVRRIAALINQDNQCFIALVCGGDGICAIRCNQLLALLNNGAGWLAAKRLANKAYAVSGPAGVLSNKVPMNRWPLILFQSEESA